MRASGYADGMAEMNAAIASAVSAGCWSIIRWLLSGMTFALVLGSHSISS